MEKLLGILPYIYFFDEPVQLGEVTFVGVPDWKGRDHAPSGALDRECLQELSACFPTTRGLSTDKGAVKVRTYFLLDNKTNNEEKTLRVAQKAITLLRYALLRPDSQALDNIESTYLYAFNLPPISGSDYRLYQCWPNLNQEIWISPKHEKFPPPGWYVDMQLIHTSQLEDILEIRKCFYAQRIPDERQSAVLLAMEWYNQSFQKYSIRNFASRLVDISIAFETLFQMGVSKQSEFVNQINQNLGLQNKPALDEWAKQFYGRVRSAITHSGRPASRLFTHPQAKMGHLSFLWSAQIIFRECVSAIAGLPRHVSNDVLLDELTPNEVYLTQLRQAGSFQKIKESGLLEIVMKLREIYPTGKREDIIWLGKELLKAYKQFLAKQEESLPTLDLILGAKDSDTNLGLKYYQFLKEFEPISFGHDFVSSGDASKTAHQKPEPIEMQLKGAIYQFAQFAVYALLLPPEIAPRTRESPKP